MELNQLHIEHPDAERLIIFLHEGLGSIGLWKKFPHEVCALTKSKGIVYDRSGYGNSSGDLANRKADYLHLAANELYEAFFENKTYDLPVYLYGHSDGGSIALIFAALYPDKVAGIITEAAHVINEPETLAGVKAARPYFNEGKFDGLKKYHGENYKAVFYAWNDIWLSEEFRHWNIVELLEKITCPALIFQGDDDEYGTIKQVELIEKHIGSKVSIRMLKNCGHAPHKEQKELVILNVKNWLNGSEA